jgi:large subunit ribosomal protein L21
VISIVECGGFQYKVSEGDIIRVPHIDAEQDAEITLEKVLMTQDGDKVAVGTPVVESASVKAKVLGHGRYAKILVMKKKRRKDYLRKNGHRQTFTRLQITAING